MSTERRQVESQLPIEPAEPVNPPPLLVEALGKARDKCYEELDMVGYTKGCDRCPVREKCCRLWRLEVEEAVGELNLTEYRRLDQKFYSLKLERDRILEKREKVFASHKPG